MKTRLIIVALLLAQGGCISAPPPASSLSIPGLVSITQLMATPHRYDGKTVRITGVVRVEKEGTAIYLTREHAERLMLADSIWTALDSDLLKKTWNEIRTEFHLQYVTLSGEFDMDEHGHCGLWPAGIRVKEMRVVGAVP